MRVNLDLIKGSTFNTQKQCENKKYSTPPTLRIGLTNDRISFGTNIKDEKIAASNKLEQLLKSKEKLIKEHKINVQKLLDQMAEEQSKYATSMHKNSQAIENVNKIIKICSLADGINGHKGLEKIAGYQDQKDILINHVARPIELEKLGKPVIVPNGVMFFGPKGVGKTAFVEAFAEQLGCRLVKIQNFYEDEKNLHGLKAEAQKAKEHFEKTHIRTILQIDGFEEFAPRDSRMIGPMKGFMDVVSKDYHCTVLATTNHLEELDYMLLKPGRFEIKMALHPANKENAADILKHYAADFADESVNYEELAKHIVGVQPEEAFSNSGIKNVVNRCVKNIEEAGRKITHTDLLKSIQEIGPDITKQALELFREQLHYIRNL